jgi:hypothetical protein
MVVSEVKNVRKVRTREGSCVFILNRTARPKD